MAHLLFPFITPSEFSSQLSSRIPLFRLICKKISSIQSIQKESNHLLTIPNQRYSRTTAKTLRFFTIIIMNSNRSDLDRSLHLQDLIPIASVSSETFPIRPSFHINKTAVSTDKHKHQAYGRPAEWLGASPTTSRKQVYKSWRPKVTSLDESSHDRIRSAPAMLHSRWTPPSSHIKIIADRKESMVQQSSLHGSFAFQDLVVVTKDNVGFDESQHSVLTADESKSSKFTNLLKMWNSATSLGPLVVVEKDEEDTSEDMAVVELADAKETKEAPLTHTSCFENTRNTPLNSTVDEKHLRTQGLGESYVSSTSATDSITTWKSFGSVDQRRLPTESLPLRHHPSPYHQHTGYSPASGSGDSNASSVCSTHHGHRGHNRPDDWVGGCQSKPAKRSWRPKTTVATSD